MNNPRQWIVSGLLNLLLFAAAGATNVITLEKALDLAGGRHRDAEAYALSAREFSLNWKDYRTRLLPNLGLRLTMPSISDQEQEVTQANGQVSNVRVQSDRRFGSLSLGNELPFGTTLSAGFSVSRLSSDTDSYLYPWDSNYSLSISQQLFGSNWLWEDLRSQRRGLEIQRIRVSEEEAAFRHRVTQEYYSFLQARLSYELEARGLRESNVNFNLSKRKYEAGIIAESDFLKLELESLERHSRFASDSLALHLSETRFRRLLKLPDDQEFSLDSQVPVPRVTLELQQHLALAQQSNIDLLESRRRQLDASLERRQAWRSMLPRVDLNLSWDQSIEDSTFNASLADAKLFRSMSVRLNWSLFEWGNSHRALKRSRLAERRAILAREASLERLELDLRARLNRIRELETLVPLRSRQLELAERDYEISQERFKSGLITGQILIDTERTLSSVRLQELASRISLVLAVGDLERLTGADRVLELP